MEQRKEFLVLGERDIAALIYGKVPAITSSAPNGINQDQVQPASLDLTLGRKVYGIGSASLPNANSKVADLLKNRQYEFELDWEEPGFLHSRFTYIIEINERVTLPQMLSAKFSPKSSTGRTDVFVRLLADGVPRYDSLPAGYSGNLYLEVTPLSFNVNIKPGLSLIQMRLRNGDARLKSDEIAIAHSLNGILFNKDGSPVPINDLKCSDHGVYLHVDLDRDVVGFVSRLDHEYPLTLYETGTHDPLDFWEPIMRPRRGGLVLNPDRFYLLPTKERVSIHHGICGDIAPYEATTGEFRTHYAGFFDPGFGREGGITGVLEVRGREVPHRLFDGHPICLMNFEWASPKGKAYEGHYQNPGPSLSKHFKDRYEVWGS